MSETFSQALKRYWNSSKEDLSIKESEYRDIIIYVFETNHSFLDNLTYRQKVETIKKLTQWVTFSTFDSGKTEHNKTLTVKPRAKINSDIKKIDNAIDFLNTLNPMYLISKYPEYKNTLSFLEAIKNDIDSEKHNIIHRSKYSKVHTTSKKDRLKEILTYPIKEYKILDKGVVRQIHTIVSLIPFFYEDC